MGQKIDIEKFVEHLNEKWKGGISCPVCKENNWNIHDSLSELREFNQGNMVIGGPVIPLASITCNNCGHTMNFNALKAGLLNPSPTKKPKEDGKLSEL